MTAHKYLLPCTSCGQDTAVETRQAGDTVDCRCGKRLDVPTLRQLTALKPAADALPDELLDGATPTRRWSARQGLLLLGSVILLVTFGFGLYVWSDRPQRPTFDITTDLAGVDDQIQQLTPMETWFLWKVEILERGFLTQTPPALVAYETRRALHQQKYLIVGFFAAIGGLVLVAGLLWRPPAAASG